MKKMCEKNILNFWNSRWTDEQTFFLKKNFVDIGLLWYFFWHQKFLTRDIPCDTHGINNTQHTLSSLNIIQKKKALHFLYLTKIALHVTSLLSASLQFLHQYYLFNKKITRSLSLSLLNLKTFLICTFSKTFTCHQQPSRHFHRWQRRNQFCPWVH